MRRRAQIDEGIVARGVVGMVEQRTVIRRAARPRDEHVVVRRGQTAVGECMCAGVEVVFRVQQHVRV